MTRVLTLLLALICTGLTPAAADLVKGPTDKVVEVVDGDTVVLGDGVEVRLVGI